MYLYFSDTTGVTSLAQSGSLVHGHLKDTAGVPMLLRVAFRSLEHGVIVADQDQDVRAYYTTEAGRSSAVDCGSETESGNDNERNLEKMQQG